MPDRTQSDGVWLLSPGGLTGSEWIPGCAVALVTQTSFQFPRASKNCVKIKGFSSIDLTLPKIGLGSWAHPHPIISVA